MQGGAQHGQFRDLVRPCFKIKKKEKKKKKADSVQLCCTDPLPEGGTQFCSVLGTMALPGFLVNLDISVM